MMPTTLRDSLTWETPTRTADKERTSFHSNSFDFKTYINIDNQEHRWQIVSKDSRVPGLLVNVRGSDAVPDVGDDDLDDDGLVGVQAPGEPGEAPEEPAKSKLL